MFTSSKKKKKTTICYATQECGPHYNTIKIHPPFFSQFHHLESLWPPSKHHISSLPNLALEVIYCLHTPVLSGWEEPEIHAQEQWEAWQDFQSPCEGTCRMRCMYCETIVNLVQYPAFKSFAISIGCSVEL